MKLFGTDGKRGIANLDSLEKGLTPELAFQIGQAAGLWLIQAQEVPNSVVMGRDTRRSGPMLGAALAAGFCSVGVDVTAVGVAPTGGISWAVRNKGFGLAAVISASHNPAPDNGIKLMMADGKKITAEIEQFIEAQVGSNLEERPTGEGVGYLTTSAACMADYGAWLMSLVPETLDGMKVAIDGAHGAAFEVGIEIFKGLGAEVFVTGNAPNGMNINAEGGATKPETIQELTKQVQADLGVAYDGDADRAVFSDSEGRLINGDRMMAIWCQHWMKEGKLDPAVVVGTVMSNGGFEGHMRGLGVDLVRTDVGDKYVSAELNQLGAKIGGEQSGHIIFPEHGPTGDGLVTALELARVLKRESKPATEFVNQFENWPQVLVNVSVERKEGWESNSAVSSAIDSAGSALEGHGRINVRASGTQPMLRVMVEADDEGLRDRVCESVVTALTSELGGSVYSRVDLTHALGD